MFPEFKPFTLLQRVPLRWTTAADPAPALCSYCGSINHETAKCVQRLADGWPPGSMPPAVAPSSPAEVTAEGLLRDALAALEARGKEYDPERGRERSMPEIVRLFKEETGIELTETQGWRFMACVKRARLQTSPGHRDSMVDLVAYEALGIESEAKKGGQP